MQQTFAPDTYKRIVIDGQRYYGKHLIVNAGGCGEAVLSIDEMRNFIIELVDRIDMVRYGDSIVERFGEGIETGISAVQLIMTSAITIHTNDLARDFYLDVFSCKDFDEAAVEAYVRELFQPEHLETQVFLRK